MLWLLPENNIHTSPTRRGKIMIQTTENLGLTSLGLSLNQMFDETLKYFNTNTIGVLGFLFILIPITYYSGGINRIVALPSNVEDIMYFVLFCLLGFSGVSIHNLLVGIQSLNLTPSISHSRVEIFLYSQTYMATVLGVVCTISIAGWLLRILLNSGLAKHETHMANIHRIKGIPEPNTR